MNLDDLKFEKLYEDTIENFLTDYNLNPEEFKLAKEWIVEAEFVDLETQEPITLEALDSVSEHEISDSIENNYEGGIKAFRLSITPKESKLETLEEAGRCTGPTQKASSDRKGKKWMQCVKNPSGKGYKRIHWGQAGVRVTGKSGNTKRKKSFRARHKCSSAKPGTPRYMACKSW